VLSYRPRYFPNARFYSGNQSILGNYHPHHQGDRDGSMCWGEQYPQVDRLLKAGLLSAAAEVCRRVLNSYNGPGAYRHIAGWSGYTCALCPPDQLRLDHAVFCRKCNISLCTNHRTAYNYDYLCLRCYEAMPTCPTCQRRGILFNESTICSVCQRQGCETCSSPGNYRCPDDSNLRHTICSNCVEQWYKIYPSFGQSTCHICSGDYVTKLREKYPDYLPAQGLGTQPAPRVAA